MKLKSLNLLSFAGLSNKKLDFTEGLNVILGPNESGKSTIYHAIMNGLFRNTALKVPEFKKEFSRFVPLKGDTASLQLEFASEQKTYKLEKSWGEKKSARLSLPGGEVITNEDAIAEKLREILPVKEGTFKNVLMTHQKGLSDTLDILNGHSNHGANDALQSLNDVLHKTAIDTAGVSIDLFRKKVAERVQELFSHWNIQANAPENNRGVKNQYKKEVGDILKAYYKKEELKQDLDSAQRVEEEIDALNQQLSTKVTQQQSADDFVQKNKAIVAGVSKRKELTAIFENLRREIEALKVAQADWATLQAGIDFRQNQLPEFQSELQSLTKELDAAKDIARLKDDKTKLEQATRLKDKVHDYEKQLAEISVIQSDDIRQLSQLQNKIDQALAARDLPGIRLQFLPKSNLMLSVQSDDAALEELALVPGKEITLQANNHFTISHKDWDVSIGYQKQSDSDSTAKILQQKLDEILKRFGVATPEQAEKLATTYTEIQSNLKLSRQNLDEALDGRKFEDLQAAVRELQGLPANVRDLDVIADAKSKKDNQIKSLSSEIDNAMKKISEYAQKYQDPGHLSNLLVQKTINFEQTQKEMKDLSPLPPEITDIDQYLDQYEKYEAEKENLPREILALNNELHTAMQQLPELTAEELASEVKSAEQEFREHLANGESYLKIQARAEAILSQTNNSGKDKLVRTITNYISLMTNDRYKDISGKESLPEHFALQDGTELPFDLLSTGAKDVIALGIRLGIADAMVEERPCFLIFDDPLVDMDPERVEKAAFLIKEQSKKYQVLFFTCHPHHADLLAGNRIDLQRL
jgi:DNA repair protein SbcC/Rad50